VGSLLTWADRVLALVEAADFIEAINLTSSYYNGKTEKITLGLPENDDERHVVVQDKLTEMIIASLKYTFSHQNDNVEVHAQVTHSKLVKDLTASCIDACLSMFNQDFLFDEVYEVFEDYERTEVFIEVLEPYVLADKVQDVPPGIMKDVTAYFVSRNLHQRLEQVICHINPASLDIDQITSMCRQNGLYDALAYVYNTALKDYITPLVEFVQLIRQFFDHPHNPPDRTGSTVIDLETDTRATLAYDAFKVFPYLSYVLTGRVYPTGEDLPSPETHDAKTQVYNFLFSGRSITWPRDRGEIIHTTSTSEPTFPYLRLLLHFDAPTLFQALDEAFEDRFLNGSENPSNNDARTISRQFIVNIFLEIMTHEGSSDIIYLYMFIARNLPKYPQFILLSGSTIEGILLRLCEYGGTDMAEEAQLAAEYLLSVFKPAHPEKMDAAYQQARFFRILKGTLRAEGRYVELLDVYLRDDEPFEVFDVVDEVLREGSVLSVKQRDAVKVFSMGRLEELVSIDVRRTAEIFERFIPERQREVVERLRSDRTILFEYLDTIISNFGETSSWIDVDVRELYISLMCEFRRGDLTRYLESLAMGDFRTENVLPVLEEYDVTDAIVLILRRAGMTKEAMHKVVVHIASLQKEIVRAVRQPGENAVDDVVEEVKRYTFVGVDLCETFSKEMKVKHVSRKEKVVTLNDAERMWLTLLETAVGLTQEITILPPETIATVIGDTTHNHQLVNSLRVIVQDIFTRLLTFTSSTPTTHRRAPTTQISFLAILRQFLTNISSSPVTDLRSLLSSIFDAYRYEKQLIQITSKLVDADLFQDIIAAKKEREQGWRPTSANCLACGRILFGPGAKGGIFAKWEQRRLEKAEAKVALDESRRRDRQPPATPDGKGKGKGKDVELPPLPTDVPETLPAVDDIDGDIVVFACGHAYHRGCLAELGRNLEAERDDGDELDNGEEARFRCMVCEAH
jgi:hypothetical protein